MPKQTENTSAIDPEAQARREETAEKTNPATPEVKQPEPETAPEVIDSPEESPKETPAEKAPPATQDPSEVQSKVYMEWATLAYRQTEKSKAWYAVMGLIVIFFVIYGLFSDEYSWIVSITFIILAGAYYVSELKKAPIVRIGISDHGINFGSRYYPYNQIKSFWIITEEGVRNLHISFFKGTNRELAIMIDEGINIAKLREYLQLQITEEEGKKEGFSDSLIRNLGL